MDRKELHPRPGSDDELDPLDQGADLEQPERDLVRRPGRPIPDHPVDHESERSDRESGRPLQLEHERDASAQPGERQGAGKGARQGRADAEPGRAGRQQAGQQAAPKNRKAREAEPERR